MSWIEELIEWQKHIKEDDKFITHLKDRLSSERIFVFTPKGEVVELPKDSTPIDFAYAIHSDIGEHAASAKVNNKMAALDSKLKNGDVVFITTHKNSHPTAKWVNMAKTGDAKRHIKNFLLGNSAKKITKKNS